MKKVTRGSELPEKTGKIINEGERAVAWTLEMKYRNEEEREVSGHEEY